VHLQQLAQVWSQSCGSLGTDVVPCSRNNTHAPHESRISTRPQTTPQRHNPRVLARDSACIFNSFPRCGAKAAAPSAPMLFPAHATIHAHHTNHESQHVHKPHHSATTNAYLPGPTCACSTACPGVEPKLPLPHHRLRSLLTQPSTRTSRIKNQHVHKPHHSATTRAYVQGSTCACSTACPGVEPKLPLPRHRCCCLLTQPNTRTSRIRNQYVHKPHHSARYNLCMFNSLPRCGAKAAAPSSLMLFSAHTTKHTHITNHESTRPQTTPQRHNQCILERTNVCMFNSLPRCGAKAAAPSSPILLPGNTTKHTHITNHESMRPQTTPQRHNQCIPSRTNVCRFNSLPRCGAKAAAPSSPIAFSDHTAKHTHITNHESTRPQTTPQRHNQCIPPRYNLCIFNSLPRCGAKAAAPSSLMLFSAHTTKHTHITNHESTRPQTTP